MRYQATISLPAAPTRPAANTQPRLASGRGFTNASIDSNTISTIEAAITSEMSTPARSSARRKPYGYLRLAARRPRWKAMTSGMVVTACPRLCRVSASRAIEPEIATITICRMAVAIIAARLIQAVRMPALLASSEVWMVSAASWECGIRWCLSRAQSPEPCSCSCSPWPSCVCG